jgi:long-chain acyl-CoA synthetase
MVEARPNYFFGPPRVWEQLQQGIISKFGSAQALQQALEQDREALAKRLRQGVGLDEADYLLTGAAPIPPSLINWYDEIGLALMEGFGQTEIMGVTANVSDARRIGSIGRAIIGVELRIAEDGELVVRSEGAATGYYKMPEKTAETFINGWVHTGDKARIDEDGFVYLTGRVKDYYKTVHGKFVAPAPIENEFAASNLVEQLCLLGRGYSKTVMLCVLNAAAREQPQDTVANALRAQAEQVNQHVAKHERIGAVIICRQPWTIENGGMTPTLKLRRDALESRLGEQARALAQDAATRGELLICWGD